MSADRQATSLRFVDGQLSILDQRLLPHDESWHVCHSPEALIGHIQTLAVRGAPLIGIAASFMLAQQALAGASEPQLQSDWQALRASRPTAVNLMNYLDRLKPLLNQPAQTIVSEALAIFDEDQQLCQKIAASGLTLIKPNSRILTHCNTGGLATAGIGTALGVIHESHQQGLSPKVWVDETRPLLQGARLTTWELRRAGIDHALICDNMAASLMAAGQVDLVLVGADRIARNGDTANKIGTYALAVLAHHHQIPFYIAAPSTSFDLNCADSHAIPVEQRDGNEVRGVQTFDGQLSFAAADCEVSNPAFDITPASLISGWITEHGIHQTPDQFTIFA